MAFANIISSNFNWVNISNGIVRNRLRWNRANKNEENCRMNDKPRFSDNGDGSVTDNQTGLVWCKEDSWHIMQDYLDFQEALAFADEMNKKDFLGHHDWRIPEKEEAEKLYIPENTILARSKREIHIDSVFREGGGTGCWCLPFDQQAAFYFSYDSGISQGFDQDFSQGYVRLVRLYPED